MSKEQPVAPSRRLLAEDRYVESQRVVRRLRAWYRRKFSDPAYSDSLNWALSDLTAFLRDEKARIGGGRGR